MTDKQRLITSGVPLPKSLDDAVRRIAKAEQRTPSNLKRFWISQGVAGYEKAARQKKEKA